MSACQDGAAGVHVSVVDDKTLQPSPAALPPSTAASYCRVMITWHLPALASLHPEVVDPCLSRGWCVCVGGGGGGGGGGGCTVHWSLTVRWMCFIMCCFDCPPLLLWLSGFDRLVCFSLLARWSYTAFVIYVPFLPYLTPVFVSILFCPFFLFFSLSFFFFFFLYTVTMGGGGGARVRWGGGGYSGT